MLTSPDFKELLKIFRSGNVRYLVVGGYAVMRYTEPRYTKDLDLWIATDAENAERVYAALKAFGAPLAGLTPKDFSVEGYFYQMGRPPFRLDIMMSIPGVTFESAWERREEVLIDGVPIPFISRADLIRAKKASGRPQDRIDIDRLEKAAPADPADGGSPP
jgi:hypothetical protein